MGLNYTCRVCFTLFQALGNENSEKKVYFLCLQNSQCFGCLHYLDWKLKLWRVNLFMFVKDRPDFRRSLEYGLCSSPRRSLRGRSAGSFREQRLVIEPR